MLNILKSLTICLIVFGAGCSQNNTETSDNKLEDLSSGSKVDYQTWPLAQVGESVRECDDKYNTITSLFYVPSSTMAEQSGYGYSDNQINRMNNNNSRISNDLDCSKVAEKLSAFSKMKILLLKQDSTSEIYSNWSQCMSESGFSDISNPTERGFHLSRKMYPPLNGKMEPITKAIARAEEIKDYEIQMAQADLACQSTELAPVQDKLIADQVSLIESAPSDITDLLRN